MALAVFLKAVPEQVKTNVLFFLEEVQAAPPSLNPPPCPSPPPLPTSSQNEPEKGFVTVI